MLYNDVDEMKKVYKNWWNKYNLNRIIKIGKYKNLILLVMFKRRGGNEWMCF